MSTPTPEGGDGDASPDEPGDGISPAELDSKLLSTAAAAGIPLPGAAIKFAPEVPLDRPVSALGTELGRWCAQKNLFISPGGLIATIDPRAGVLETMLPERFGSWIEDFITTVVVRGKHRIPTTLTNAEAGRVLSSDNFRRHLRPIVGVNPIRLPSITSAGELILLPAGYDAQTQTYTLDGLTYPLDWTLERANAFAADLFGEFPWGEQPDPGRAEQLELLPTGSPLGLTMDGPASRRSASVCWSLTIGNYVRNLFPPGTPRPMGLYLANQPGSGKTRLAQIALAPTNGAVFESDLPKSDDEMAKTLSTFALNFSSYVFFDDIGRSLYSNKLNRFITSSGHTGRVLGGQRLYKVPNVSQVYATGNWVKLSDDLQRRCLVCELFLAGSATGRDFKSGVLTAERIAADPWRADCLAALWATVSHWHRHGATAHPAPMPSFEAWSSSVGGIAIAAGWTDPLAAPTLDTGGNSDTVELQNYFEKIGVQIVEEHWPEPDPPGSGYPASGEHTFSRTDLTTLAREWELLEWLVGSLSDDPPNSKDAIKFGNQLRTWRGREIFFTHEIDTAQPDGSIASRAWQHRLTFGRRHSKKGSVYPVTVELLTPSQLSNP